MGLLEQQYNKAGPPAVFTIPGFHPGGEAQTRVHTHAATPRGPGHRGRRALGVRMGVEGAPPPPVAAAVAAALAPAPAVQRACLEW